MKITFRADQDTDEQINNIKDYLTLNGMKVTQSDVIRYALHILNARLHYSKLSSEDCIRMSANRERRLGLQVEDQNNVKGDRVKIYITCRDKIRILYDDKEIIKTLNTYFSEEIKKGFDRQLNNNERNRAAYVYYDEYLPSEVLEACNPRKYKRKYDEWVEMEVKTLIEKNTVSNGGQIGDVLFWIERVEYRTGKNKNMITVIETMRNNPLHGYDDWIKFSGLPEEDFIEAWNACIENGRISIK